jgi:hypothetical protein
MRFSRWLKVLATEPAGVGTVATALVVLGALTAIVELRRQGLTESLSFVPDETPLAAPLAAGADALVRSPAARSLEIHLIDGLRCDVAESQREWQELASRGARLRARIAFPAQSVCVRAQFATGAPPEVTGILGASHFGEIRPDNLLARAAGHGLSVDGTDWIGPVGLAFPLRPPARTGRTVRIEDCFECDDAGHEHGASSPEYRAAARTCCARVLEASRRADLSRDLFLALSDHGHLDGGGHLGLEPEVATVPVILVGAGVRPGVVIEDPVPICDVSATVSLILGLPPPSISRGVPIEPVLVRGLEPALEQGFVERRAAVERSWDGAVQPAQVLVRRVLAAGLLLALLMLKVRPRADRSCLGALLGPTVAWSLWHLWGPPLSAAERLDFGERYGAIFALSAGASIALAALLRCDVERFARSTLAAWLVLVSLLLVRHGLGPGGLSPSPRCIEVVLAAGSLACVALLVLAVSWAAQRPPGSLTAGAGQTVRASDAMAATAFVARSAAQSSPSRSASSSSRSSASAGRTAPSEPVTSAGSVSVSGNQPRPAPVPMRFDV